MAKSPNKEHIRHVYRTSFTVEAAPIPQMPTPMKLIWTQRTFEHVSAGFRNSDLEVLICKIEHDQDDQRQLLTAIEENPRRTIQDLAMLLNASWSAVQEHLHKPGVVWRQGIWVPRWASVSWCGTGTPCRHTFRRLCKCSWTADRDEKWILYTNLEGKNKGFYQARILFLILKGISIPKR